MFTKTSSLICKLSPWNKSGSISWAIRKALHWVFHNVLLFFLRLKITNLLHSLFQTGEFDAYLCRQELERLQRLEAEAIAAEASLAELDKPRRDSASNIDDFFVDPPSHIRVNHMSYVSPKTVHGGPTEDDVFFKPPPLWEDITSSIQVLLVYIGTTLYLYLEICLLVDLSGEALIRIAKIMELSFFGQLQTDSQ